MSKEIMTVKQQVRLENWAAEVESCTASGLTIQQWCRENGLNPKDYLTEVFDNPGRLILPLTEVFSRPGRLILPLKFE